MFERFTEHARQVIVLAQEEVRALQHDYIGTEHILLGLLREDTGIAARVLKGLDLSLEAVRADVARIIGPRVEVAPRQIPFTPRAKKVLELALREALTLGHNYIGTEHILLGLAGEGSGVGARILRDSNASAETIRSAVIRALSGPGGPLPRTDAPESQGLDEPAAQASPAREQELPDVASASDLELEDVIGRLTHREGEISVELRRLQEDIELLRGELSDRRKRRGEREP